MQRLIARMLLLIAFVGNLSPLTLALAASPHACCVRKAVHRCHDAASADTDLQGIRNPGDCSHDCCRAVRTVQSAQTQPPNVPLHEQNVEAYLRLSAANSPNSQVSRFQSTRAPPDLS